MGDTTSIDAGGVACFVKQLGSQAFWFNHSTGRPVTFGTENRKGGDWIEWPRDLRVRQWPEAHT